MLNNWIYRKLLTDSLFLSDGVNITILVVHHVIFVLRFLLRERTGSEETEPIYQVLFSTAGK